ncbi:MAG TPA: hypothetical protein VKZ41_07960 [Gemmatimonadales bacterium]|nr:hypothetical protein [Gemmatimonadales bacterium]
MFSHQLYNVVHVVGIALIVAVLGGIALHAAAGANRADNPYRRLTMVLHGIGSFLILLGGFGMLARIGFQHGVGFPGWLWTKIGVWAVLSFAVVLPYRQRTLAMPLLVSLPLLAGLAAYMAIYKPV